MLRVGDILRLLLSICNLKHTHALMDAPLTQKHARTHARKHPTATYTHSLELGYDIDLMLRILKLEYKLSDRLSGFVPCQLLKNPNVMTCF